ncbi:flagellar hook-basal body complex protein FliE [Achromobacter deleyi]|uniref:flagellar hook-basal body complex protein FliE n=1 Tax=Achromobacter deleyi TaxID=1353891 RepID=UPI001492759D|nr:flagellar hook-basal body complex protein FliE [Achromobacter deleyi]QVQ26143.1 flagellar hook-basal body complex protein FliE [Achromobacter deleyi]UIP21704.1 flagellar hook-basal body complex protein FliE [Achromobacter deleyi]
MSIAAIEAIQAISTPQVPALMQVPRGPQFDAMVSAGLNGTNRALLRTEADAQRLAVGEVQNLHQVMIHMEEAKASFQLLLQVRNRLLDAYQEVMRMQI